MIEGLLALFFPERCRGCGAAAGALCMQCKGLLSAAEPIFEPENAFALYHYGHPLVRQAVWELKYQRKSPLAHCIFLHGKEALANYVTSAVKTGKDIPVVLIPIPQHWSKTLKRGFNQSLTIARWAKQALPGCRIEQLLRKTRETTSQARTKSRSQRKRNLRYTMKASRRADPHILYIIVDDVITTGSTVIEAGRALRAAGAKHVCAIAIAHGYLH